MWEYFCALQLVVLVSREAAIQLPFSTTRFVETVFYSITLRPLKDMFTAGNHKLSFWLSGSILFEEIGGILVSTVAVAGFLVFILIYSRLRKTKNTIIEQIRKYLMYNFLIRYFQTTYLLYNYVSFFAASSSKRSFEKIVSSSILIF